MNLKELKTYKRDALLGALGAFLMLVGDLCLSVIPASGGDNGRENQAERFAFQNNLRSGIYRLRAGFRLCRERREGLSCGLLAVARYPLGYESYRSFSYRRRVGRAYEGLDDSGHRRSKALYYGKGQVPEMAFRDGRYADNFGGAIRDYDDIGQIKRRQKMLFETMGSKENPAVLFFHAMGVTGASRAANLSQNIFAKNISAFCQP